MKQSIKKLPDGEFQLMKALWHMTGPATAPRLTEQLAATLPSRGWRPQTVASMLLRLEKKGFLRSEKPGRERVYFPQISEQTYLEYEARDFSLRFSNASVSGLIKALYDGRALSEKDIDELRDWISRK